MARAQSKRPAKTVHSPKSGGQGAPRPQTRAQRVISSVLDATLEELGRVGFAALSVEEVALRAGVNKTTIYRRWPTKPALVQAAFERFGGSVPTIDTGSLRGDLLELIHAKLELARTSRGRALVHALQAETLSPGLLEISRRMRVQDTEPLRRILDSARARGELRRGLDDDLVISAIEGPFTQRFLIDGRIATTAEATRIIDLVLNGALAPKKGR